MSFLDWPVEVEQASRKAGARRKRVAEGLIALFRAGISPDHLHTDVGLAADQRAGVAARRAAQRLSLRRPRAASCYYGVG